MPERLSIEGLRYARAVAETGSFSAAARQRDDAARLVEWHFEAREALGWTSFLPFAKRHRPTPMSAKARLVRAPSPSLARGRPSKGYGFRLTWCSWMRSSSCEGYESFCLQ